jgi:hypothetical protein
MAIMNSIRRIPTWVIVGIVIAIVLLLVYRTSGYSSLSPGDIKTDKGDGVSSIFDLKTDLTCVAGNTAAGQDGSAESFYNRQDGVGYGICGAEALVKDEMNYKILNDESPLGD